MTKIFDTALAAITPQFKSRLDDYPSPEIHHFPISAKDVPAVKDALRFALPKLKPSHRLELFARMGDYNTAAALQADLRQDPFCAALAPFLSEQNEKFIHTTLLEQVGTQSVDPRSWVMAHHLYQIVISWVARSRFRRAHPQTDDDLLAEAENFSGDIEGAYLFEHIIETKNLGAFISLPGKTMTKALNGLEAKPFETRLKEMVQAFAFGVAVDATTYQGDFDMKDIEIAAEEGQLVYEHEGDEEEGELISAPTKKIARMLEMAGESYPELVYDSLGCHKLRDYGALDAQCFALAMADGLPASLWALKTASLLLATEMGGMSLSVASRRLYGSSDYCITELLPDRDWSSAKSDWRRNIPGVTALTGLSESEAETAYGGLMDDWWEERPLLDFWLEMIDGIAEGRHFQDRDLPELLI